MNVAVVTTLAVLQERDEAGRRENQRLKEALERQGAIVRCIAWDGPEQEWRDIEAMVIRTTWNYHLHANAFRAFIERRAAQGCRCFNAARLMAWNIDKHYLQDLDAAGVPIVPTHYLKQTAALADFSLPTEWQAQPVVIKPTISASAHDTLRFDTGRQLLESDELVRLHRQHDLMVQPFQHHIAEGEVSLVAIAGELLHAVCKVPAKGEFRVQGAYGGEVISHQITKEERELVNAVMAALPEVPVYARIDVVKDNQARVALMELELIEPQLFLDLFPQSADALARHVVGI